MTVELVIPGEAAPQGSKTRTRYGLRESSRRVGPWRDTVRLLAVREMRSRRPLDGPVEVWARFTVDRPRSHRLRDGSVRASAPRYPMRRPGDLDKLCRALLDAITGSVIRDDSQVVRLYAERVYGRPHTWVRVSQLGL